MRWIRMIASLCLGVLAAAAVLYVSQRAELDCTGPYACDPGGNLYLLTGEPALVKVTPEGVLEWTVPLPDTGESGVSIRYGTVVSDRSGSIYVTRQDYRRQVNALGEQEEVTLSESVLAFHGDGEEQSPVLTADLTGLSRYSTANYILDLRAHGDSLLAVCHIQGQYEIIRIEPYGETEPQRLSKFLLDRDRSELQDCTALSDGGMVCTTLAGELYYVNAQGNETDLRLRVGAGGLVGRLSADETDCVYITELRSGAYLRMNPKSGYTERIFNSVSVVNRETETTFDTVCQTRALGDGVWCARSLEGERPAWLCFDREGNGLRHTGARRTPEPRELMAAAAVGLAAAVLTWLLLRLLGRLRRRSKLTGRILVRFLPVFLAVLAAASLCIGALSVAGEEADRLRQASSASKAAACLMPTDLLERTGSSGFDARKREQFAQTVQEVAEQAWTVSGIQDAGLLCYILEDGRLLGVCATLERDQFYNAGSMSPLFREFPDAAVRQIREQLTQGGPVDFYRDGVRYISCFQPVWNGSGELLGMVEARVEGDWTAQADTVLRPVGILLLAAAVTVLWLLLVLVRAFRPLKELRRCINAIAAGDWNVKARIDSRDELAEIGESFNQMTERLNQYISGMVRLNNEYIKFIPRELFRLIGKNSVTDLSLGDWQSAQVSMLCVTFLSRDVSPDSEERFREMNRCFDPIFQVVDRNHGVIQRFDGAGVTALFPGQTQDALNAAISLKGIMAGGIGALNASMLIAADQTLVGVAGNEKRQTIAALSPTIRNAHEIQNLMEEMGARYVLTGRAMEGITGDIYFNCREIGGGAEGRETLYEFLDGMEPYEKKLYLVTREEFERGVHAFQAGRYPEARKCFASVLQVNEQDRAAMYYLLHCGGAGEVRTIED